MIAATALTLSYRGIQFLDAGGWWSPLSENSYALLEGIDPSVIGVLASCIIFVGLTLLSAANRRKSSYTSGNNSSAVPLSPGSWE